VMEYSNSMLLIKLFHIPLILLSHLLYGDDWTCMLRDIHILS
jgi:hypothetical protein